VELEAACELHSEALTPQVALAVVRAWARMGALPMNSPPFGRALRSHIKAGRFTPQVGPAARGLSGWSERPAAALLPAMLPAGTQPVAGGGGGAGLLCLGGAWHPHPLPRPPPPPPSSPQELSLLLAALAQQRAARPSYRPCQYDVADVCAQLAGPALQGLAAPHLASGGLLLCRQLSVVHGSSASAV
jgi:hypothetical protein